MAVPAAIAESATSRFTRDTACDLCADHEVRLLATQDRRGRPLRTVVCRCCGLISHETIPTDEELAGYYAHQYRRDYHGERQPSAKRVLRAWDTGQSIYRRLQPFVREGDEVFEVGAGLGCTLKAFELAGHRASGIDPGVEFQAYSRDVLRARVENACVQDLLAGPSHDLVLLVHVIEHFNRPARALRQIYSLLRPGGRLYVECPNVYAPHAAPGHAFHYAHVYNFTPWTLRMMGERSGFRVIRRLSSQRDRNLAFLFVKAKPRDLIIDAESYAMSVEAVTRFNTLTYHCRPTYVADRIRTLSSRVRKSMFARRRVRQLIDEIHRSSPPVPAAEPRFRLKVA